MLISETVEFTGWLAFAYLLGRGIGLFAMRLRNQQRDTDAPSDFLALAMQLLRANTRQRKTW